MYGGSSGQGPGGGQRTMVLPFHHVIRLLGLHAGPSGMMLSGGVAPFSSESGPCHPSTRIACVCHQAGQAPYLFSVLLHLLPLSCCDFSWRLSDFCHTSPDFHLGTEHPVLLDLCCYSLNVAISFCLFCSSSLALPSSTGPLSSLFSLKLTVLVLLLIFLSAVQQLILGWVIDVLKARCLVKSEGKQDPGASVW